MLFDRIVKEYHGPSEWKILNSTVNSSMLCKLGTIAQLRDLEGEICQTFHIVPNERTRGIRAQGSWPSAPFRLRRER